jgi:hypothetical protein
MVRVLAAVAVLVLVTVAPAAGQVSRSAAAVLNPPWPRIVVDLRGATNKVPAESVFYPPLPPDALVPARGFGLDAGAQIYAGTWKSMRLGYGADFFAVRATQTDLITVNGRFLTPQLSLNFGSSRGWSYVSGGVGLASIRGDIVAVEEVPSASRSSGWLTTINVGGGARWFVTPHVAFTFDLRLHRLGRGTGDDGVVSHSALLSSLAAGISVR